MTSLQSGQKNRRDRKGRDKAEEEAAIDLYPRRCKKPVASADGAQDQILALSPFDGHPSLLFRFT